MMDNKTALKNILKQYLSGVEGSAKDAEIAEKLSEGTATYAEVYETAIEHGKHLSKSLPIPCRRFWKTESSHWRRRRLL